MSKIQCEFEKCGGVLMPNDNGKSPKGLYKCKKCKSIFRMMIKTKNLVIVTNMFTKRDVKPIPLKVKMIKVKVKVEEE